ncbi:unnamed protein product [Psylliodes chrysocephalus]|uniref:Dehydrogenase/reductase SDR family member 4 n=1 Tax=Psylliodes chrysocephalus TaxID=3402493 RepID=A0A9P0DCX6_9CUCU|nr:unnamed protein product [Psylliodes chrysocephala]
MLNNALRLQGRKALVTGSTSGIGLAIAERLATEGAKVIVSSRQQNNVDDTVKSLTDKGLDVRGVVCHIGKTEERKNLVKEAEKLGGLDIFVQCAGVNPFMGSILDCPEEAWDKTFDINVKTSWLLTKELFHLLKQSKHGRVIYNSSVSAFIPYEVLGAYPISKMALISLTKMAALHLGHWNVTVNCLVPGVIETPFSEILMQDELGKENWMALSCIKRFGKPNEVAGLTAFLASDDSTYISGEAICITGGFLSRM